MGIIYEYYLYTCSSTSRDITLGILYGYKGVLQAIALLFAFQIRKVKVKGLNDAKYIAGAIYVTSIILVVTIVSTFALSESVIVYPVVFGLEILLGTTAILVLAFVPKVRLMPWLRSGCRLHRQDSISHLAMLAQNAKHGVSVVVVFLFLRLIFFSF